MFHCDDRVTECTVSEVACHYVHIDHIIGSNATDIADSGVILKPVIVPTVLDNQQAQSDSDVSTTLAQSEQPSLTNEVEILSNRVMQFGVREVDSPVAECSHQVHLRTDISPGKKKTPNHLTRCQQRGCVSNRKLHAYLVRC